MKIGILGGAGRMGRTLIAEVLDTPSCALAGATEHPGSALLGKDLGLLIGRDAAGVSLTSDVETLVKASDALIDFTAPDATMAGAELAAKYRKAHIIGTTGLSAAQEGQLAELAKDAAIVYSRNMSIGVNLLLGLTRQTAANLDEAFDIEILEMHHRHKVDAPSGTALMLGDAAAAGRGVNLADVARKTRDGHPGARPRGEIGFATLRGGDVVGDHTVIFAADGERIELTHKASDRRIFASGAVRAALWTRGKKPGLYSMRDVVGVG